jgi:hypothetical protein
LQDCLESCLFNQPSNRSLITCVKHNDRRRAAAFRRRLVALVGFRAKAFRQFSRTAPIEELFPSHQNLFVLDIRLELAPATHAAA